MSPNKNKSAYIKDPFFKRKDDKSENIDQEISILNSQPANPFHNRSVQNDMRKSAALKERGYRPNDKRTHNVYSSMFSNASGIQSQMNSIMLPKRPGSNASVVNSEYNVTSSVETSQNSLRQAIMSTIKRKTSKNDERIQYPISDQITQLDSKFTKSLQINSPDSKFSHRENKIVVKSPQRKFTVKYKTTLIGHQNTITCLAFNTKFYTSLYSGSKDYTIKAWHCTSFSPRTIITDDSTLQKAESSYKTINTHTKYINSLCFLPNSGLLVSSGADQRLAVTNVFNSEEFETVRSFRKTFGTINHIISMNTNGFEIDECKIIIGSNDKTIRLIDLNSPDKVVTKMINNDSSIRYLKLHSSNNYLMTADSTNSIKLWDIRTSSQVSSFKDKGGAKTCIDSIDADNFVCSSEDGVISTWDYRMPTTVTSTLKLIDKNDELQGPNKINQILCIKGTIFAACDSGLVLCNLNKVNSNLTAVKEQEQRKNHQGPVLALCYSEYDSKLFSAGFDQNIIVWMCK